MKFCPSRGEVLFCSFDQEGKHIPPEMRKNRLVLVISRKTENCTCTVIPLSGEVPNTVERWHYELPLKSLPGTWADRQLWAKCDMLCTVSVGRLDRVERKQAGVKVKTPFKLAESHFSAIVKCVLHVLAVNSSDFA